MSDQDGKPIALIYQCVFCGSYTVFEVGSLVDHEVELIRKAEAAAKSAGKKAPKTKGLKKDLHAAEQEYMTRIGQEKSDAGANWLPCSCCIEHYSGWRYLDLLHAATGRPGVVQLPLQKPVELLLSPLIPVIFEDLPPVYRKLNGKWTLAEGVGPKTLEVIKAQPTRLPASQFKVLLKGEVAKVPGIEYTESGVAQPAEIQFAYREFLTALWAIDDFEEVWNQQITGDEHLEDQQEGPSHPALAWHGKTYLQKPVMCSEEDLLAVTHLLRDIKLEMDAIGIAA